MILLADDLAKLAIERREQRFAKSAVSLDQMLDSIRRPLSGGGRGGVIGSVIQRLNALPPEARNALLGSLAGGALTGGVSAMTGSGSVGGDTLTGAALGGIAGGGLTLGSRLLSGRIRDTGLSPQETAQINEAYSKTPANRAVGDAATAALIPGVPLAAHVWNPNRRARKEVWSDLARRHTADPQASQNRLNTARDSIASVKRKKLPHWDIDKRTAYTNLRDAAGESALLQQYPRSGIGRLLGSLGLGRGVNKVVSQEMDAAKIPAEELARLGISKVPRVMRPVLSAGSKTPWGKMLAAAGLPAAAAGIYSLMRGEE